MRAGLLKTAREIQVVDVDEPDPSSGELLIEIRAAGVCGSDIHAFRGHHPFRKPPVVLGHEAAGRILPGGGADGRYPAGARVAIMPLVSCWRCPRCRTGMPHMCAERRVPGAGGWPGLLSERVAAPGDVLYELADSVSYAEGAMIEPLAVAWRAVRGAGIAPGHSVAVLGAGTIGALVARLCLLHQVGALMVSDVRTYNLEFTRTLGPCHAVNAAEEDVVAAGHALTGPDGFDAVIVASGHPGSLDEAIGLCRPLGTVIVLPLFASAVRTDINPLVLKEVRVQGVTVYTPADFSAAANLVNSGRIDVRRFITKRALIEDTPAVFTALDKGLDRIKVQIEMTS
ncbi:MAG: alcohol dehydrogenase catalytic domain-containing protein [Nocardiopsaceae bacterium]|nr:alcohol dehydrogenase catalytic domain-containing protein [Nocardiopsaceae bacterium]